MDDVTQLLERVEQGDSVAVELLLKRIYPDLRRIAAAQMRSERSGQTLQATALVNEAYFKLFNTENRLRSKSAKPGSGRAYFFRAAADAMQQILIDKAREKGAEKRGDGIRPIPLIIDPTDGRVDVDQIALKEVLDQLQAVDPQATEVVKLRYFVGCTIEETAEVLDVSVRTVNRLWKWAKAWLLRKLSDSHDENVDNPGTN